MSKALRIILIIAICQFVNMADCFAWRQMRMPELFIKGRYLMAKDINGNDSIVNLHGFGQTYSPYFNDYQWCRDANGNINWSLTRDVAKCVRWNEVQISYMLKKGWMVNWMRLHMDPYWSNTPGVSVDGESDIHAFDFEMFKTNLDKLFIPVAEYAISQGIYIVMRPPGVCPQQIAIGDNYHKYLIKVWTYVCNHPKLKNNPNVMFELANEPVAMKADDGQYTNWSDGSKKNCTKFFQEIIDKIRALGCNNILWVPGLNWQQSYDGFVKYPLKGENLGLAVHCYPGWYGSDSEADGGSVEQGIVTKGNTYADFQAGWNSSLEAASKQYPILITEMDWAPKKYNSSWGKATTGTLGGTGFGANFRYIMDRTGNVSWMLFTDAHKLAVYDDAAPDGNTFLTDPEACPRMCYRWFQEYANPDWKFEDTLSDNLFMFPGTSSIFNASIWETGSLIKNADGSRTLTTGKYGFGGWQFGGTGTDLSDWKYLVVTYAANPGSGGWSLRLFDEDNYWTNPYMTNVTSTAKRTVVNLKTMKNSDGKTINPAHICILGFWSYGGAQLKISDIYLTNNSDYSKPVGTAIDATELGVKEQGTSAIFNLQGQRVTEMKKGRVYVKNGRKFVY